MLNKEINEDIMRAMGLVISGTSRKHYPKVWKYLVSNEKIVNHFTFDRTKAMVEVIDKYGTYTTSVNGNYVLDINTDEGKQYLEFINRWLKEILGVLGYLPVNEFKVMNRAIKYTLARLIPDEDYYQEVMLPQNSKLAVKNFIDDGWNPYTKDYRGSDVSQRLPIGIIYGIYYEEELLYIGQTTRPLKERVEEHIEGFMHDLKTKVYSDFRLAGRDINKLRFRKLYESEGCIFKKDLDAIERLCIFLGKPKSNVLDNDEYSFNRNFKSIIPGRVQFLQELNDIKGRLNGVISRYNAFIDREDEDVREME